MKESIINYFRKNKNKKIIKIFKVFLRILFLPISSCSIINLSEDFLRFTLHAKRIRDFWLANKDPHFSDLRPAHLLFYKNKFPGWLNRGFYSRQAIRKGDIIIDIGCGNGFFDYFFFSDIASSIDAIDTNEDALEIAKKIYSSKNIFYYKLDVTKDSFPRDRYNVIIMDSSIMYLKENDTEILMSKIASCMDDDSLFVGSATMQSLENTEKEKLQKFYSNDDMEKFLLKYFEKVHVWSNDELVYKQVYFRCARTDKAFEKILKN